MQQLVFGFPESLSRTQSQDITIPKLKEVSSITTNTGSVSIESILNDVISIKLTNGASTRKVETGGTYTPKDTKYVTGQRSANYNVNGYIGTLTRYLYSGGYTPAHSKTVTATNRIHSQTRRKWNGINFLGDMGSEPGYIRSEPEYHFTPGYFPYDVGGYKGNLPWTHNSDRSGALDPLDTQAFFDSLAANPSSLVIGQIYTSHAYWTENFSGVATKPASDTSVYRYRGYVTKPAVDTRTYDYYYQYVVTVNYLEKSIDFSVKIGNNKRTVVAGWVKINNELRDLDVITSKINGVLKEVKS